jgi:hypothetical protein
MAMRQLLVLAGVLIAAACGGDRKMIKMGPAPAKATTGALAGPLCKDQGCTCMTSPEEAGAPAAGQKRFEIRLGPTPHDLWLTLPGHVLYKSAERPDGCFYVDLPPGAHPFELRASQPDAVSAAVAISELGTKTKSAYATFRFSCGSPGGVCSFEELDGKKAEYQDVKKHTHDPCGSTKIKEVVWDTGKSPDHQVPSELALRFVMQIYKFEPEKPSGDPTCGVGEGRRHRGEEGGDAPSAEDATPPVP